MARHIEKSRAVWSHVHAAERPRRPAGSNRSGCVVDPNTSIFLEFQAVGLGDAQLFPGRGLGLCVGGVGFDEGRVRVVGHQRREHPQRLVGRNAQILVLETDSPPGLDERQFADHPAQRRPRRLAGVRFPAFPFLLLTSPFSRPSFSFGVVLLGSLWLIRRGLVAVGSSGSSMPSRARVT